MVQIMIVEDNKQLLKSYQNFFSTNDNYAISTATNGATALELYKRQKYDIILLDLKLPKKNGIDVINVISAIENDNKKGNIIVISGSPLLRFKLRNTKKVYKIFSKPFNINDLNNTINNLIQENSKTFPSYKLNKILLELNLKTHSKSVFFLVEIIKFLYYQPYMLENINKIYYIIGKRYNCSSDTIKSSVRSAIRIVNKSTNYDILQSIFYFYEKDYNKILTPKYFMDCILHYLQSTSTIE